MSRKYVPLCFIVFTNFITSPLLWIFTQTTSIPLKCLTHIMLHKYFYIQFLMCVCGGGDKGAQGSGWET